MKSTAIACLLGCASAIQINSEYRPNVTQSPWAAKAEKPAAKTSISGAFQSHEKFTSDYERTVPAKYTQESDDRLMNSLIGEYALEQKDKDGLPVGKFFLDKKGGKRVATEVARNNFGFSGEKANAWVNEHFEHAWNRVDPLKDGFVPIMKGPVFLRDLSDSVELSNTLQLQMEEEGAITNMNEYRPINGVVAPWSVKPETAAYNNITGAYHVGPNYGADWEYARVIPENFKAICNEETCDKDDKLMNSILAKYALEQKLKGAPTGKFYLSKDGMRSISKEVIGTHMGYKGKKGEKYLNEKFPGMWSQADVNKDGFLQAQMGPPFLRTLLDSVELSNGLQL
jgi:hypothetical protein